MIAVKNLTETVIDKNLLKRVAKIVLKGENIDKERALSVVFVNSVRIKELNKKYRKKNKPTDILSFEGDRDCLGEMAICLSEVKRNAKQIKLNFKKELALVLIHGILHLLGYDHENKGLEARRMKKKEEYYLSKIFS